ncbi:SRPBCC domain-containing protein [bacterium]|nr:SRPBCC domain-containing protein [bacterium]
MSDAAKHEEQFVFSRVFDAPRELVFKVWTEAEHFKHWWGPKDWETPVCDLDFRVGGTLRYCMKNSQGHESWGITTFQEIVPPEKLVLVDRFTDSEGNDADITKFGIPEGWPDEMLITVLFEDVDGKTRLTVTSGVAPELAKQVGADIGWEQSMDKLEMYLATQIA